MNTLSRHLRERLRTFADTIGPLEVAALARTVPTPETDELVRILVTGTPSDPARMPSGREQQPPNGLAT